MFNRKVNHIEVSLSPHDRKILEAIVALVDDLKAATAGLDAAVVALTQRIAGIPTGGSVSDADVQAAITDVQAQTAAVNALVPPAPPATT